MSDIFKDFINLYPVTKTLRFRLEPVGKTEESIQKSGLLQEDEERSEEYKKAKKIIDEYHKDFIRHRLADFKFVERELDEFNTTYQKLKKDKYNKKIQNDLSAQQKKLRGQVAQQLKDANLLKGKLIEKDLPRWLKDNDISLDGINNKQAQDIIYYFKGWTTYFEGFNENRKNIYTSEEHSTSIGYRLIHENLPKFLDNIERYNHAKELKVDFSAIKNPFKFSLDNVFAISGFNLCLTQDGIDKYNLIRGGQSQQENRKLQGINEAINLRAQELKSQITTALDTEKKNLIEEKKAVRACKLEELFKQILSDRNITSFRVDAIENDADLCEKIQSTFSLDDNQNFIAKHKYTDYATKETITDDYNIAYKLPKIFETITEVDPTKIYIQNGSPLQGISRTLFSDWGLIDRSLEDYCKNEIHPSKEGKKDSNALIGQRKSYLKKSLFSFEEIHKALEMYFERYTKEELQKEQEVGQHISEKDNISLEEYKSRALNKPLFDYFKRLKTTKKSNKTNEIEEIDLLKAIREAHKKVEPILGEYKSIEKEELKANKDKVTSVKNYLDAIMDLYHFLKPLSVKLTKKDEKKAEAYEKDTSFYGDFDVVLGALANIVPLYNQARNYLTKKPFSVEKYKLNFKKTTLADGWDKNKETANSCVILRKDGQYYLGVMDGSHNALFTEKNIDIESIKEQIKKKELDIKKENESLVKKKEGTKVYQTKIDKVEKLSNERKELQENLEHLQSRVNFYQKMNYKQISDANKDIQNLIDIDNLTIRKTKNLEELKNKYLPEEVNEIRRKESYKTREGNKRNDSFNKDDLAKFTRYYIQRALKYEKWKDFHLKIKEPKEYSTFTDFTDDINRQGYIVDFQTNISANYINSCVENGKLYLFKIYSKDFSEKSKGRPNLQSLYWWALFDKKNLQNVVYKLNGQAELFYRKNSITKKNTTIHEKGKPIRNKSPIQGKEKSTFDYDIIKDRRYTKDTFLFHVPITCNFKARKVFGFNAKVNNYLKDDASVNIIGIDRGERHLAYYTIINQKGEIIKDKEGNYLQGSFNNPTSTKNYHELLDKREKERGEARKLWGTIEKIKDIKTGYLSQVVHKIATLMVEHNAIVVFEDLNFGFKKGRFKIEKQVYQKLEKMLIDKLNYLVFKDKNSHEVGGTLKALQLTAPFESFKKLGKQTGFIFYVPAYHTSKVCPATGFVNLLYPKYETIEKAQNFFGKFDKICFNKDENHFEFHFDYQKFTDKAEGSKQKWVVYSHGTRLENFKNNKNQRWDSREVNLTDALTELFESNSIDCKNGDCLIQEIIKRNTKDFFRGLLRLLWLILQMRNSKIGTSEDWLVSPVKDKNGNFFDSRHTDESMPQNADANGAYHIAMKGLLMIKSLAGTQSVDKFTSKHLSNKKWYEFIQSKNN